MGDSRPIFDLRRLHKRPLHCKTLTVPKVPQNTLQGDWFAMIDIEAAYFQISIWEAHWHYLRTFTRCTDPRDPCIRSVYASSITWTTGWCVQEEQQCNNVTGLLHLLSMTYHASRTTVLTNKDPGLE